ncbi:MAG: hypothetical protein WD397_03650 [Wenzhouxiangellaceae bacterium]
MTDKRVLALLFVAVLVAVAVVLVIGLTGPDESIVSPTEDVDSAADTTNGKVQSPPLSARISKLPQARSIQSIARGREEELPSSYNSHDTRAKGPSEAVPDDDEKPESIKEWEAETHYPKNGEFGFYTSRSDDQLRQLAEGGDPIAQKEWGSRLALGKERIEEGVDWLIEAASHGSQYALGELIVLHQLDGPTRDPMAVKAWAQVSYMLGNWQIAFTVPTLYDEPGSLEDRALVGALSAVFYEELNRRHLERTGEPLSPLLRPGYREMLDHYFLYGTD